MNQESVISIPERDPAPAAELTLEPPPHPAPPKKRRRIGWIIAVVLLSLALLAALAVIWLALQRLDEAREEIKEQQELIEKKETFSAAMRDLMATASAFDGTLFAEIVPQGRFEILAHRAWTHRWNGSALAIDTSDVRKVEAGLAEVLKAAQDQAAVNATGSTYEAVLDQLGGGYVTTVIDDADAFCHGEVAGCVSSQDPYVVHIDADEGAEPWMTDLIRSGVAYHEFAHVLQLTNPDATDEAVEAFGGDIETMADCYALTYLPGWTLDHTIWVSSYQYYEVSVGYGYTCDEGQRQVVRDWYDKLGYQHEPVSQ